MCWNESISTSSESDAYEAYSHVFKNICNGLGRGVYSEWEGMQYDAAPLYKRRQI